MISLQLFVRLAAVGLLALVLPILAACSSAEDRARSHFERGQQLVSEGDRIRASLEFRNALQLKANYPDAQFALGEVQEQQAAYTDAARSFLAVAEQVPSHLEARVKLAYILAAANQLEDAEKYTSEAVALAPDDASVLVLQATIAMKHGDNAKGVELAKAALAADPKSVDALMVLASERLMNQDPAAARAYLDQAPPESDTNAGLQVMRLAVLEALDDQPAVEALFVKLGTLFPDNSVFRDGLVRWYISKGRNDDAGRVIREHAAKNPLDDQARLTLVAFLATYAGKEAALADLEAAIAERGTANGDTFALRMALAQLKLEADKGPEALEIMQSVVADTTDPQKRNQARVQLSRVLVAENRNDEAETIVDTILADDARNVDALSVRASLHVLKGANADAISDLLQALNEAPDNANLHGMLAEVYERDGSVLLAEEQYSKALDLTRNAAQTGIPVAQFFLRYGKTEQALRTLEAVREREPENRQALEMLAQLKLNTQDWAGAQQLAHTLRQLGGDAPNPEADRINAAALVGLNRADDGIKLLQASVADAGTRQTALPQLIGAYMQAGKVNEARDELLGILKDEPDNAAAQILLGTVYAQDGKADLAEAALIKAADIKPGLEGEVALARYYISFSKPEAAEAVLTAGLAQDPANQALLRQQAILYMQTERFDDAIAVYEKLYSADQTAVDVANDLASLLSERTDDPAALERAFQIAQRLRGSEIPQYLDTLGWIYYLRGEYDAALPLLRTAAGRLAEIPLVHFHLGMAYSALGQKDLARASLERALSMPLLEADAEKARLALSQLAAANAAGDAAKS